MKRTRRKLYLRKETLVHVVGSWPIAWTLACPTRQGLTCGPACPSTNTADTICKVSCAPGCNTTLA